VETVIAFAPERLFDFVGLERQARALGLVLSAIGPHDG